MAPKRGAPSSPAKRVAKKTKVIDIEDPWSATLQSAFAVLNEDESLTDEAREMFRVSAPFALRVPKAERHKFQESVVTTLAQILQKVETTKHNAVEAASAAVATVEEERKANADLLVALAGKEKAQEEMKLSADNALKQADEQVAEAKRCLGEAQKAVTTLEAENEKTKSEKAERETLISETWTSLKEGTIPGNQWRLRNKHIEQIVAVLKDRNVEASCFEALPVALKDKVDQRGPIAIKCVDYVQVQLDKSVQHFADTIASHESKLTELRQAEADAGNSLKAAEGVRDERITGGIDAENALLAASEEHKSAQEQCAQIAERVAEVAETLKDTQHDHLEVKSVIARFEAVAEGGEAGAISAAAPTEAGEAIAAAPSEEAAAPEA
jgi:chromosome segregation ATPase